MNRRIFHGNIHPNDVAHALLAEFNPGSLRAQAIGQGDKIVVQLATPMGGATSGGQTAIAVTIQRVEDGVMIELGSQEWLGVAASIGQTAWSVMRNPLNLLHRLDDLAQDIVSLQLSEKIWKVIERTVAAKGASHALSERLSRITCEFCGSGNSVGEGNCLACGAPLGQSHPTTCANCGFAVRKSETVCPNCNQKLI